MWSNRSGWESCIRALFFYFSGLNNLQGRYLSLPSRGSFHEVWHDCCNVHMTFSGYMSSCQRSLDGFHYLEMGHGVIPPQNTSQSLFYGTYHWTSARPALLNFAATHCLCPLPSFFLPSFHSSACPVYFFSPFQISSITAECVSSALGNAHKMLDRLLTQRILSATTYSCSWPPGCVGCSILIPLFKYFCEHALLFWYQRMSALSQRATRCYYFPKTHILLCCREIAEATC